MNLVALPAFTDNYIWMFDDGRRAVVVDPGDAAPVIDALDQRSLQLAGILVTHHRGDHVGGVDAPRSSRSMDVVAHIAQCERTRADGRQTLPSHIATERRINPFLRCAENAVLDSALAHGASQPDAVSVLAALREWKNQFR